MLLLEKILGRFFVWSEKEIQSEIELFHDQEKEHEEPMSKLILRFMDNIDAKSSAILTHVSMMIAVLSISVATLNLGKLANTVIIIEMALYVIASLGLLRCLSILSSKVMEPDVSYSVGSIQEAALRRVIYLKCRALTILVTVAFFLTILLGLASSPFI